MAKIITNQPLEKLLPQYVPMTPYQVYLNQIKSAIEPIRFATKSMSYLPPQLGGLTGQRNVISEAVILQMIDFEIK